MAYSTALALQVREVLAEAGPCAVEQPMFGGLAFMVRGHMTVGVMHGDLLVRVGRDAYDEALTQPATRPMDFTGKPMLGWVLVAGDTLDEAAMKAWVHRGLAFTASLPAK